MSDCEKQLKAASEYIAKLEYELVYEAGAPEKYIDFMRNYYGVSDNLKDGRFDEVACDKEIREIIERELREGAD